jgi:hypothetical protein
MKPELALVSLGGMRFLELVLDFEMKRVLERFKKFDIEVPGCSLRLKKDTFPDYKQLHIAYNVKF